MLFSSSPAGNHSLYRALPILALPVLLSLLVTGCASPGPPRPPSLNLPQPVTDLTAQRVGDQVLLHWTTPTKSTDGLLLKGNFTARICRTTIPAAQAAATKPTKLQPAAPAKSAVAATPCTAALRVAVHTGVSSATDTLSSPLTADPIALLDYRVEIENSAGHTAGLSNPALTIAGSAPPTVEGLKATTVPTGAMLEWHSPSTTSSSSLNNSYVELDRINAALAAATQKPTKSPNQTPAKSSSIQPKPSQPLKLAGQESPEIHLRATPTDNRQLTTDNQLPTPEATGTIDHTARFGETYHYTAQRARTITFGTQTFELRSISSGEISLTLRDTFPPAAPTGLATIPNQPSNSQQSASIDLSWNPNSEPDLAGYFVYRRPVGPSSESQAPPIKLTPNPIPGPAYRDLSATPGQTYAYTVTAIDNSNNESTPSTPTEETLPQP